LVYAASQNISRLFRQHGFLWLYRVGHSLMFTLRHSYWPVVFAVPISLLLCFGAIFVTLSPETMEWLDLNGKFWQWWLRCRQHDFRGSMWSIPALALSDAFNLVFEGFRDIPHKEGTVRRMMDSLILFVLTASSCLLVCWVLATHGAVLATVLLSYTTFLLSLIVLSNVLVTSALQRDREQELHLRAWPGEGLSGTLDKWALRSVLPAVLFIVSVLGFAYRVYPFIPVQKAGGNYATATRVRVILTSAPAECSPSDLALDSQGKSGVVAILHGRVSPTMPYILIEEDSDWLYVAPERGSDSGGGPSCWKWGVFCRPGREDVRVLRDSLPDPHRPHIFTINRHCVAAIPDFDDNGTVARGGNILGQVAEEGYMGR
jgi:hypothetical protein